MDNGYMVIKHGNNPLYMEVSMESYIWVNYHISLTWIVRPFWMILLTNYDYSD